MSRRADRGELITFLVYTRGRESARVAFAGERLLIGRSKDADISCAEQAMSLQHAEITPTRGGMKVRDRGSLNGTYINGRRIVEAELRLGDEIEIGETTIVVSSAPAYEHEIPTSSLSETGSTTKLLISIDALRQDSCQQLSTDLRIMLLRDLGEALRRGIGEATALAATREVLTRAFDGDRVFVLRPTDAGWSDPERDTERASITIAEEAVARRSAVLSVVAEEDERFAVALSIAIAGIKTAIAAPVLCSDQPLAVLYVDRTRLPSFEKSDLSVLGIAANQVSAFLESAAHLNALHDANQRLALLNQNLEQLVLERTEQIRMQGREIQRLADAKDEILAIAAHDIRGPLQVIVAVVDVMQWEAGDGDRVTVAVEDLKLIQGVSYDMARLLTELLDSRAITEGKIELHRRPCLVREFLRETAAPCLLAARQRGVVLELDPGEDLSIYADPRRFGQALVNVILNAISFTERGKRVIVEARRSEAREEVEIRVRDFGRGIPKDQFERIFQKFETVPDPAGDKAEERMGGSGLGLAIAKRLVEVHGGRIEVESELGVGTCFTLTVASPPHRPPGGGTVIAEPDGPLTP